MDDPHFVGVIDALKSLTEHGSRSIQGHSAGPAQERFQSLPPNEFHHHKIIVALSEEAKQSRNVGVIQFRQCYCFGAEPFYHLRLTGQLGAQSLDSDFPFEHQVDALIDGAHSPLADFFQDFIIADDGVDHTTTWASRVCLMSLDAVGPSTPTPTTATVILSYPPRSLAREISSAQAEWTSAASTACIISLSSTRSYSPSEHSRKRSPPLMGKGSPQLDISTSG